MRFRNINCKRKCSERFYLGQFYLEKSKSKAVKALCAPLCEDMPRHDQALSLLLHKNLLFSMDASVINNFMFDLELPD